MCCQHGISIDTYYNCKSKYGGKETSDIKNLHEREKDNSQQK
ncbi:hypothetical protein [Reinekea sp. G2M2-21]